MSDRDNNIATTDRVESFISAIDNYEPKLLQQYEDAFRIFARFVSRNIDARYLRRHPTQELLADLEHLMASSMQRDPDAAKVRVQAVAGESRGVLTSCMEDQPFIYSSVRLSLEKLGIKIYRTVNAVMPVRRDAAGHIQAVGMGLRESFIWMELEAEGLSQQQDAIEAHVNRHLLAARAVVRDFPAITQSVTGLANHCETLAKTRPDHRIVHEDNAALLRWLLDGHFVFLGCRYLPRENISVATTIGDLGLGRLQGDLAIHIEDAELAVHESGGIPPFLWIRKSQTEAWLYRQSRMDHILVQCFGDDGRPAGLLVLEGLFSFQALAEPRNTIPILHRVIDRLYAQLKAEVGSHRYRTIRNAFNSLPLEYLFPLQFEDVQKLVEQVLEVDASNRMQVHMTSDELQNTAFVFVAMPRSHYNDELRSDVRRLLKERFRASSVDDGVYASNVNSVTFHYFLTGASSLSDIEVEQLRTDIDRMANPWVERLLDEAVKRWGAQRARHLYHLYASAFPGRYREETSVGRAVADIELLEDLSSDATFDCDIYRENSDGRLGVTRLRLFQTEKLLLSEILPVLDNFGLIIIDQFPTAVHAPGRPERMVATFRISGVQHMEVDLLTRRNRLRNAIKAVMSGAMSNGALNRLLLRADIPWNYVSLIRAYQSYARQVGLPFGLPTVQEALLGHGDIVRSLTELFRAKFDPNIEGQNPDVVDDKRQALVERSRRALELLLDTTVHDLTSDQILRTFFHLIDATVRTNFYARNPLTQHHVVLKFDPTRIPRMPAPRPYREIYVHHPLVSGLHLRGGPIARGGLRWSDRLLDFRTEVLGLMATQNLKNALIVPRGAKGCFVLRQPPVDMKQRRDMADVAYKIFVGGLLDVTDNLVDGVQITPPRVLCYDSKDHYLVVAADKGTAHQSDNANGIARERQFWLDDAFASGGSQGYDHKKEAITSRGAWECVKRHFREMGLNPERDQITVIGIGDMSGDVFGNGMLRSKSMQLVAAFDHRHIFIDPNPDPQKSFRARQKLFRQPGSTWEDYDFAALSEGAGIYPRGAKTITLSPQARQRLHIEQTSLSGLELVKAVLRAPVDLFWNGGIGTYVRASTETNLDVGDVANDDVRIDGTEVHAKVIGEGGNLGITQLGRVELAGRGILLNTDAVDNSAGVDLSDHEVNLKILFAGAHQRGAIKSTSDRDTLMIAVREEVNGMVLANNWLQSRMISLDSIRARHDPARFQRTMHFLSERVPFNRREHHLPGERILRQRMQRGECLFRPELAILAAHAKLDLRQELAAETSLDLQALNYFLLSYFPESVVARFADDIRQHPLGLDIARTVLTNHVVADAGATWLAETTLMSGQSTDNILKAYFEATTLIGAKSLKNEVDRIESHIDATTEYKTRLRIEAALESTSGWLLRNAGAANDRLRDACRAALLSLPEIVDVDDALSKSLSTHGADPDFVRMLGVFAYVEEALDVASLAVRSNVDVSRAGQALYQVGEQTGMLALIRNALEGRSTSDLDRPARFALRDFLRDQLVRLTATMLDVKGELKKKNPENLEKLRKQLEPLNNGDLAISRLVMAADRVGRHTQKLIQA